MNALANDLAEARCLTSRAEFDPDQESQRMQKFTKIDEMCKCSEAGKVMFEKSFQNLKKDVQAKITKCTKMCHAAKN